MTKFENLHYFFAPYCIGFLCISVIFSAFFSEKIGSYILRRPQNFAKSSPYFCPLPSSIYSCSIGHILEHDFCHLGCWAVKGKFLKRPNFCLSMLLFGVVFSTFCGQKNNFSIFFFFFSVRVQKLLNKKLKKKKKKF